MMTDWQLSVSFTNISGVVYVHADRPTSTQRIDLDPHDIVLRLILMMIAERGEIASIDPGANYNVAYYVNMREFVPYPPDSGALILSIDRLKKICGEPVRTIGGSTIYSLSIKIQDQYPVSIWLIDRLGHDKLDLLLRNAPSDNIIKEANAIWRSLLMENYQEE